MNPIEPTLFIIVFAFAISLLIKYSRPMSESVSLWITWKHNDIKISRSIAPSPLKRKSDLKKDKLYKQALVQEQMELTRQEVTKYFLLVLTGLTLLSVSIFWLINYSTIWKTLLQFLLA